MSAVTTDSGLVYEDIRVGDGTLCKSFMLGAHAADAAKVEGCQNLDNLRAFAHHFMKCHIPGNRRHAISSC